MPIGTLLASALLFQRQGGNPFAPPSATIHDAPNRTCDLTNVNVALSVDYPNKTFKGHVVNTLSPLRSGLTEILLHAGADLTITNLTVDGSTTTLRRDGENLLIAVPTTQRGRALRIALDFAASNSKGRSFGGGGGGFHWIVPGASKNPDRVGFWTQGETMFNRQWCPTWDYPNDLTTVDESYTVPADWTAIGNGSLVSEKKSADGKTKTFVWKGTIPQATYLMTAVGGPFDIKKAKWRGVPLWYVVPRGEGKYIDDSFSDTPDMLSFYSDTFGYKYPWAKYAQNAMYDFGGGMENASATTLQEGALTEAKDGFRNMASLNSHELGHQWFGDTVTCRDWGDTFLNESFATVCQMLYFEHSRGENAYLWEVENNQQGYLFEARRFERPVSTKLYNDPEAMFGSGTTYDKGGDLLHTMRRWMGDEAFFAGIGLYLNTYQHTPVNSAQLERAMTDASGLNVTEFVDQWFRKPGHPVLDYGWSYADGTLTIKLKQTQDTSNGTPIYKIPNARFGVVVNGALTMLSTPISGAEETFTAPFAAAPTAVVLDPDHDFLRVANATTPVTMEANVAILRFVKDPAQRTAAMAKLVADGSQASVDAVVAALRADREVDPAFRAPNLLFGRRQGVSANPLAALADLKKPELRAFWMEELEGKNAFRRAEAVVALGDLPSDPATTQAIRARVNDKEYTAVVVNALKVLAAMDKAGNKDVFEKALKIEDKRSLITTEAKRDLAQG